ncbi:MAG: hypothetical protein RIC80_21595 [Cyclobacteriaceae bacterium]
MEKLLIFSHVFCGVLVLILGMVNLLNRKGAKNHLLIGKIYVAAMWWICLSAALIISFYRFSGFLLVIAVLTFYSTFVGVRVLRRKQPGTEQWYDWLVAGLTAAFGISLFGYGIYRFVLVGGFDVFAMLCLIFGFITANAALQDIRFFATQHLTDKQWWLRQHIGAMGGSYIAAITAAAVQNGEVLMPGSAYNWILWLLPAIIGTPIINIASRQHRKRRALETAA